MRRTDGSPAVRLGEGYLAALSPDDRWAAGVVRSPDGGVAAHAWTEMNGRTLIGATAARYAELDRRGMLGKRLA